MASVSCGNVDYGSSQSFSPENDKGNTYHKPPHAVMTGSCCGNKRAINNSFDIPCAINHDKLT